uniref:Uncharacterized protein n=1 Tax=Caenorhabditis japonica TaxID=281687 RepID=A0A8R1EDD7_CAEJA
MFLSAFGRRNDRPTGTSKRDPPVSFLSAPTRPELARVVAEEAEEAEDVQKTTQKRMASEKATMLAKYSNSSDAAGGIESWKEHPSDRRRDNH